MLVGQTKGQSPENLQATPMPPRVETRPSRFLANKLSNLKRSDPRDPGALQIIIRTFGDSTKI
jgi:hypothetical protein